MIHVAILLKPYLELILDGRKTVELRLTRTRRVPFRAIEPGDRIYLKQSGGPFRATAIVRRVDFHDDLTPRRIQALQREFNHAIRGGADYWRSKRDARYATLVWLADVESIEFGPKMRPHHGAAWQVLPDSEDVYPRCLAARGTA